MKKVVLKLDLHDDIKAKRKALKAVSSLQGINSLAMDMKEKKMTVIGEVDPVDVVRKLRKLWYTEIVTVGPAKEEQSKKGDDKKSQTQQEQTAEYLTHNPYQPMYYSVHSAEENPNSCVIC